MEGNLVFKVIASVRKGKSSEGVPMIEPSPAATAGERADDEDALRVLAEVDQHGRRLAGDDPVLRHLLGGLERTLAQQLGCQVRRAPRNT